METKELERQNLKAASLRHQLAEAIISKTTDYGAGGFLRRHLTVALVVAVLAGFAAGQLFRRH